MYKLQAVRKVLYPVVQSKGIGLEDVLTPLVAEACTSIQKATKEFNTDRVRVCKIVGNGLSASTIVHGMVLKRVPSGVVLKAVNAGVAVYDCPIDVSQTDTKGKILRIIKFKYN